MEKITQYRDILHYSFGTTQLPPRERDLYTNGVKLTLFDFDALDPDSTVVLNSPDIDSDTYDMESIRTEIFGHMDSTFKFIASCNCGYSLGNAREGYVCKRCGTTVRGINPEISQFRSMFRIYDDFPPIMHPVVYRVLNTTLGKSNKVSRLDMLFLHPKLFPQELKDAGFEFGLSALSRDFDKLWTFISTKGACPAFIPSNIYRKILGLQEFYETVKDVIFIKHLPILNKNLHLITSNSKWALDRKDKNKRVFTDSQVGIIMQMYHIFSELRFSSISGRKVDIDKGMGRLAMTYYSYVQEILVQKIIRKKGYVQQNVIAGRMHNTLRGVITPRESIGDADELFIPWVAGVACLRSEIVNLLRNRYDYSLRDALRIHNLAINKYDPLVHEIINTLIHECPFKGLPILFDRNPTLNIGSIQLLFVTKVKSDISDVTISMHQSIVKAPNADLTEILIIIERIDDHDTRKRSLSYPTTLILFNQ